MDQNLIQGNFLDLVPQPHPISCQYTVVFLCSGSMKLLKNPSNFIFKSLLVISLKNEIGCVAKSSLHDLNQNQSK